MEEGWCVLLDIYFNSEKERKCFEVNLLHIVETQELQWQTDDNHTERLQLFYPKENQAIVNDVMQAFIHVFITHYLPVILEKIIRRHFYYTDEEEVQRIVTIANSLFEQEMVNISNDNPFLKKLFYPQLLEMDTIYFHSFLAFRVQSCQEVFIELIGKAIDEFKMEEDHQTFIEAVRKFAASQGAKMPQIHVVQGDPFTFFTESGNKLTYRELHTMMQAEPLYIVGLDENEMNLAPLLAMSPEKIFIYGENPSEAKTLTVINIFLEKVTFKPLSHFPFVLN